MCHFIAKKFKEFLITYENGKSNDHHDLEYLRQISFFLDYKVFVILVSVSSCKPVEIIWCSNTIVLSFYY